MGLFGGDQGLAKQGRWRRWGRRDGRRSVAAEVARQRHEVSQALEAVLKLEVQSARDAAAEVLVPIDGERAVLVKELEQLVPDPHIPTDPMTSRRRANQRRLDEIEQGLALLDVQRSQRNDALVRRIDQLLAQARRADASYRQGYTESSPTARALEPLELALPADLMGPIPDPVRPALS